MCYKKCERQDTATVAHRQSRERKEWYQGKVRQEKDKQISLAKSGYGKNTN